MELPKLLFYILDITLFIFLLSQFITLEIFDAKNIVLIIITSLIFIALDYFILSYVFTEFIKFILFFGIGLYFSRSKNKVYCFFSILFIIIGQIVQYLVTLILIILYNDNFILLYGNVYFFSCFLIIILCTKFFICSFIFNKIQNLIIHVTNNQYQILFGFNFAIYSINVFLLSYSHKYVKEIYMITSIMYLILIVTYIMFGYLLSFQYKYYQEQLKEQFYQKQIEYMKNIAISNAIYQKDYHDIYSLVLKTKDTNDFEIFKQLSKKYINEHKYLLRFLSGDEKLDLIINSYINHPNNSNIQIETQIMKTVRINEIDLMILFNEIFQQLSRKKINMKIVSHHNFQIHIINENEFNIGGEIFEIIKKYKGLLDNKENKLLIILFYDQIGN